MQNRPHLWDDCCFSIQNESFVCVRFLNLGHFRTTLRIKIVWIINFWKHAWAKFTFYNMYQVWLASVLDKNAKCIPDCKYCSYCNISQFWGSIVDCSAYLEETIDFCWTDVTSVNKSVKITIFKKFNNVPKLHLIKKQKKTSSERHRRAVN